MWQEVRQELHPKGLEVVTVALDVGGFEAAGKFIERANPEHPACVDQQHLMDELFGVVNVPSGIWIDEGGSIVRAPEPAWPGRSVFREIMPKELPPDADPTIVAMLAETRKIRTEPDRYLEALRDWADKGRESRFALSPDDVVRRSRPRPREEAEAAAHFELGQHLWRDGRTDPAVRHFRDAHRLAPDNWTYRRQAWSFADPLQRESEVYEGNWLADVRKIGAENYYPPFVP